jgi:hypothetical protein
METLKAPEMKLISFSLFLFLWASLAEARSVDLAWTQCSGPVLKYRIYQFDGVMTFNGHPSNYTDTPMSFQDVDPSKDRTTMLNLQRNSQYSFAATATYDPSKMSPGIQQQYPGQTSVESGFSNTVKVTMPAGLAPATGVHFGPP